MRMRATFVQIIGDVNQCYIASIALFAVLSNEQIYDHVVFLYICLYMCVHIYAYMCAHVYMLICVYICLYMCTCICAYVCVHVYMLIYVLYIYTYKV